MIARLALLIVLQQRGPAAAGRPCSVAIDSIGRNLSQRVPTPGDTNRFAGGGVLAHCEGTGSTLSSDSVAMYSSLRRIDLVGRVRIRDTALALDANFVSYFLRDERLEAHNNVVAVNRTSGSVLRGPNLTYFRAVPGVRDTVEMFATGRPTIEYRQAADTGEPYRVVGDRVRMKGDDRIWGRGNVTVDRRDLAARADSMLMDEAAGVGVLVGSPRVDGKGSRPYTLVGTRIELALDRREIRLVKALGSGEATGTDWRLTADTIHLVVGQRKLEHAFAWGAKSRPYAVSSLNTIKADSIALDMPNEVLTEMRAFGKALSTAKRDSSAAAADIDWIAGDSLVARFAQEADSAGVARTRIRQVVARGSARALTHHFDPADSTAGPAINYSRGKEIAIALKGERIDRVIVAGGADGVHLEPRPPAPPDSAKRDTTRARAKP